MTSALWKKRVVEKRIDLRRLYDANKLSMATANEGQENLKNPLTAVVEALHFQADADTVSYRIHAYSCSQTSGPRVESFHFLFGCVTDYLPAKFSNLRHAFYVAVPCTTPNGNEMGWHPAVGRQLFLGPKQS